MEYEELSRLEHIVENLLSRYGALREEKEQLAAELKRKELELGELREAATRLKEEKNVIHGRVNSLISSLEKWEKAQAADPEPVESSPAAAPEPVESQPAVQQDLQYAGPSEPRGLEARG